MYVGCERYKSIADTSRPQIFLDLISRLREQSSDDGKTTYLAKVNFANSASSTGSNRRRVTHRHGIAQKQLQYTGTSATNAKSFGRL